MSARASYLWRALGATAPLFAVSSPSHGTWNDGQLVSLSISLGSSLTGLSTSTANVDVRKELPQAPKSDQGIQIYLTTYGRDLLAALTGANPALITYMFTGRIASQTVTDHGARRTTSVTTQDWPALVSQLDVGAVATREEPNLAQLYRSLFTRAGIPYAPSLQQWGSTWHWVRWAEDDTTQMKLISTSDVLSRYTADVGNLILQRRDGTPVSYSHDHMRDKATLWRQHAPDPLQRSQVIAPVEWTQPATVPLRMTWQQMRSIGEHVVDTLTARVGDTSMVTKGENLDMTHIWVYGDGGLYDAIIARLLTAAADSYRVEKVSVDVLALMRSPANRAQVGQLLSISHGDALTLGHDWPDTVSGVYFVERIAHQITPSSWVITLDLMPVHHVTGTSRPTDIAGRTWDTAYYASTLWDAPPTTWETSP